MTKAQHEAAIAALEVQLEALRESPISEYQSDNSGQRMGVKYRSVSEIIAEIKYHKKQIAKISGSRALAVFRDTCG